MGRIPSAYGDTLRRLTLHDDTFVADVLGGITSAPAVPALDTRTQALVRLGALIALDAGPTAIERSVMASIAAGASPGDVVDVLLTVAPTVGSARVVSAAPRMAAALGYDVAAALERFDDDPVPDLA
jgi:alkylhydroperoxidase/carboxymuconolactone decarboxylase family protein YurZ